MHSKDRFEVSIGCSSCSNFAKPGDCLDQPMSSKETLILITITQYLLKVMKMLEIMKRKVYESLGPTCINLAQRNPKLIC